MKKKNTFYVYFYGDFLSFQTMLAHDFIAMFVLFSVMN